MAEPQSTAASPGASKHVPAWKRIGLKLKYAKAEATAEPSDEPTSNKRERAQATDSSPAKKPRIDSGPRTRMGNKENYGTAKNIVDVQPFETPAKRNLGPDSFLESNERSETHNQSRGRRSAAQHKKSVSFTPDTKQVDGISASNFFKAWQAGQSPTSESDAQHAVVAEEQASPLAAKVSKKKKRKKKKGKAQASAAPGQPNPTDPSSANDSSSTPEYVEYLLEFSNDKDHWKFNKKKQSELLKHFFNLSRIPSQLNDSLVSYVSGLQGAAAQQRLLDEAEGILRELLTQQDRVDELEGMESRADRKAAYERALQRELDRADRLALEHPEWMQEQIRKHEESVERAKRANAVLEELLLKELRPPPRVVRKASSNDAPDAVASVSSSAPKHFRFNEPSPEPQSKPTSAATRKRTRKSRTDVSSSSDDSSSSSESSSDDDDDDDHGAKIDQAHLDRIAAQQPASRMYARRSPGEEAELRNRAKLDGHESSDQSNSSSDEASTDSDSDSDSDSE